MFITKVTHLPSCTLTMFSYYDTSKWSQFLSDHTTHKSYSYCYATSEFHKLGINAEQIICFITNHSKNTLKEQLNYYNLPIHVPSPQSRKSNFWHFFIFDPMVAQVKIVKCLILSDAHYLHPRTFEYLHLKKLEYFFATTDNTFLGSESPNCKNHTQTAITQQPIHTN